MKSLLTAIFLLLTFNVVAAEHEVFIEGFAFRPAFLKVALGDSVVFLNRDRAAHNVVARENSLGQFEASPVLRNGQSFTLEIDSLDAISAHCSLHPAMAGIEIIVIE